MIQILYFLLLLLMISLSFFCFRKYKNIFFSYPFMISFIVIICLTYLSFKIPLFSFIFVITISCFLMLLSLPLNFFSIYQEKVLAKTLLVLYRTYILDWLAVIHIKFFSASKTILYSRFFIVFGINLGHIFLSRWYLYQKTFLNADFSYQMQNMIFLCLFVGVAFSYLRFLLSFSLFILPLALKHTPSYLSESVLYVFGEDSNHTQQAPQKETAPEITKKNFSLLNVNFYRNYYRQSYSSSATSAFKYAGFCVGVCAMGAAFATAIYAKEQTEYTRQQTEYTRQQAYDTRREADAAAVDSGLITKEEYWRRHPQDALHKPKKE